MVCIDSAMNIFDTSLSHVRLEKIQLNKICKPNKYFEKLFNIIDGHHTFCPILVFYIVQ